MTTNMRMDILFLSFIVIFVATAIVTLLGVTGVIHIDADLLNKLVLAFLVELAGAVIGLYKQAKFFSPTTNGLGGSLANSVEKFDELSDGIKEVINRTQEPPTMHHHGLIIKRSGSDVVAYQKMQTITPEQLDQLPKEQRDLIRTYATSMNRLRKRWHELWPKRIDSSSGKINEDVNNQLLQLIKGMQADLVGILDFLEQQGIYLDDHYREVRQLIKQLS